MLMFPHLKRRKIVQVKRPLMKIHKVFSFMRRKKNCKHIFTGMKSFYANTTEDSGRRRSFLMLLERVKQFFIFYFFNDSGRFQDHFQLVCSLSQASSFFSVCIAASTREPCPIWILGTAAIQMLKKLETANCSSSDVFTL